MNKRTFEEARGEYVDYISVNDEGKSYSGTCSREEWEAYKIQEQLIKDGADEKLVEALYDAAYSIGFEDCQPDW
jgi:hypothetical protein